MNESKPHCCPVCDGTGKVPANFYLRCGTNTWVSTNMAPETCQSCKGTGIVWSPATSSQSPEMLPPYKVPETTGLITIYNPPFGTGSISSENFVCDIISTNVSYTLS